VKILIIIGFLETLKEFLYPWPWAYTSLVLIGLLLVAALANWVTKRILLRGLHHLLNRLPGAETRRGSHLMRVISRLSNVVPSQIIAVGISGVPDLPSELVGLLIRLCQIWVVLTVALAVSHALDAVNDLYDRRDNARDKPIKGYLQVIKIIVFVAAGLSIVATLVGVELRHLVAGLGAATAVLMLVFQDTILSLVASVQISGDGRVRIGDWIEMPGQNADGDVIDISLHTITVQNWDKTITTIPTRKLVSDSFKNWRGMSESGGRRIKRSLFLDQHSVHFLDNETLARMERFGLLDTYLTHKQDELEQWNAKVAQEYPEEVNARRLTNLGTFRAYVERYLRNHPSIHQEMTLLVRQLAPTSHGLPLELYCFTSNTAWGVYESIQSDIFDHLLAILPEFGLRVFQESSDAMFISMHNMQRQPWTE